MPRVRLMAGVVLAAGMLLPAFVQPQPAAAASANVAALQAALRSLGYYGAAVDGVSGPLTRSAVLSFQRRRGLAVDGIAGPATRSALGRRGRPALGSRMMRRGMRGWDVAALQYLLARRGYPPGAIDGAFGPITGTAVRNYQSRAGLSVDELAGPPRSPRCGAARAPDRAPRHRPARCASYGRCRVRSGMASAPRAMVAAGSTAGSTFPCRSARASGPRAWA